MIAKVGFILMFALSIANAVDFVVYGNNYTNTVNTSYGDADGMAFTLPVNAPLDLLMVWPTNSAGVGAPMMINQTEFWWSVPAVAASGETLYVHGVNLELGNDGLTQLYIDGHGWVENKEANPYMAAFTLPTLSSGVYTGYVHNGHGRAYGWSDSFSFEIANPIRWTNTQINITAEPYNADSTGATACDGAIRDALLDCPQWGTVYFPTGTYMVTNYLDLSTTTRDNDHRWLGDGPTNSTIYYPTNFTTYYSRAIKIYPKNYQFESIGFKSDYSAGDIRFLYITESDHLTVTNCLFDGLNCSSDNEVTTFIGDNMEIYDTTFKATRGPYIGGHSVIVKGCSFIVNQGGTRAMAANGAKKLHASGNLFHPFDTSNEFEELGWAQGRCIVVDSGGEKMYIGGNTTSNMAPRWSNHINRYGGISLGFETATASTTSVTNEANPDYINTVTVPAITNGFSLDANGQYVYGTNVYYLAVGDKFKVTAGPGESGLTFTISAIDNEAGVVTTAQAWKPVESEGPPLNGSTLKFSSNTPRQGSNLNSGEQFLWEHQRSYFRGAVLSAVTNTITIEQTAYEGTPDEDEGDFTGMICVIVKGTGFGQSRPVSSGVTDGVSSVITLGGPIWDVIPDATSIVSIGKFAYQCVVYNNDQDGFYNITAPYGTDYEGGVITNVNPSSSFASRPASFYGASTQCIIADNRATDLFSFADFYGVFDRPDSNHTNNIVCPSYFNVAIGNSSTNARVGYGAVLGHFSGDRGESFTPDVLTVGNLFQRNTAHNVRGGASFNITISDDVTNSTGLVGLTVWNNNTATAGTNNTLSIDSAIDTNLMLNTGNSWQ